MIRLSWSAIESWRRCPEQYYLGYRERLRAKEKSRVQVLGTAWHRALAEWHALPVAVRECDVLLGLTHNALRRTVDETETLEHAAWELLLAQIRQRALAYRRRWGADVELGVVRTEVFAKALWPHDQAPLAELVGYVDGITESGDIVERKTGNPDAQNLLVEGGQAAFYHLLLGLAGTETRGVLADLVHERYTSVVCQRERFPILPALVREVEGLIGQTIADIQQTTRFRAVGAHCRYCDFRPVCRVYFLGGDWGQAKQDLLVLRKGEQR